MDSIIIASFPKITSGVGASYSWSGTNGNGSMKTLSLIPTKEIIQQINFGTGSKPEVYWKFNTIKNTTEVTWGMRGKSGLLEKAYLLTQGGIKKNRLPIYTRGLELIDQYIMKELENHAIEIKGVVAYGGEFYLYQTTSSKMTKIEKNRGNVPFYYKVYDR